MMDLLNHPDTLSVLQGTIMNATAGKDIEINTEEKVVR